MDISYTIGGKTSTFSKKTLNELGSFLLKNPQGDYIIQSVYEPTCKSFGFFRFDQSMQTPLKVLDWFGVKNTQVEKINISEYRVEKYFKSPYIEHSTENVLEYESFTKSPKGGFVYKTNSHLPIQVHLDVRYFDDFSKFGKFYNLYEEEGIVFIEFTKKNNDLIQYQEIIAISTPNIVYTKVEQFVEQYYKYDDERQTGAHEFIYNALEIDTAGIDKEIHVAYASSKEEVLKQLKVMNNLDSASELMNEDIKPFSNTTSSTVPMSVQTQLAYKVGQRKLFDFMHPSEQNSKLIAGYPWFYQEWRRDEILSLRAFLEIGEEEFVKQKLIEICNCVDEQGELKRLEVEGSLKSPDSSLLLAKRIEDFIFHEDKMGRYQIHYDDGTIHLFYNTLYSIFNGILQNKWNSKRELVRVEQGEWWRDTLNWVQYPLGMQVAMLNTISALAILSRLVEDSIRCEECLDFEQYFKNHIREIYMRKNHLFDEPESEVVTSDVFLAYYTYPDLCSENEWITIFKNTLNHTYMSWGGITSLSKYDSRFCDTYSGSDDESYHQGDSWYFMNAIAAISLSHCNSNKFKDEINTIIQNTTHQLLFQGTLGHIAEVSSAKKLETKGCSAQMWSLACYIEMLSNFYKLNK
ncbi:MAG: amylo-alpha-1,6-glucosidase [Candidatus Nanoarchaeia archaeon]